MLCLIDKTTDPYYNLAAEEYLLKEYDEPLLRLWRNAPAVIVGRYQNTNAEINHEFIRTNKIPVVRRLSGGGAVFHDLGNINFTFIDRRIDGEDTSTMFKRFTLPIIDALGKIGVNAYLEGRNDLLIDGRKFSGNAVCVHKDRVLQHGTLLYSASIKDLSGALNTRPEKFVNKGVKSNISRVTNISEHLPESLKGEMNAEVFMEYLKDYFLSSSKGYIIHQYSEDDIKNIKKIESEKYRTDLWNYGESPRYRFSNSVKLPIGFIEVYLDVKNGVIQDCNILGDYFFTKPTEDICRELVGTPHQYDDIYATLRKFNFTEYFGGEVLDDVCNLLS